MSELGVIGHVTRDLLAEGERVGGAAAYGALAGAALGIDVVLVTSLPDDPGLLGALSHPRIKLVRQPSALATTFELSYAGPRRRLWVRAQAEPLSLASLTLARAPVLYVGPVVGEVDPEHLRSLSAARLVLGVQGWLRTLDAEGEVISTEPSALWGLPEHADLVLSEEDHEAADALGCQLSSHTRSVLVTRGVRGVTCFSAGSALISRTARSGSPTMRRSRCMQPAAALACLES